MADGARSQDFTYADESIHPTGQDIGCG
jgi:hypothetical protein